MAKVKFSRLSYASYRLKGSNVDKDTIYFILDKPFIFLNGQQYGITIDEERHLVDGIYYDEQSQTIKYTIAGGTEPVTVTNLTVATSTKSGLMSKEHVSKLNELVSALQGVSDVKLYVEGEISKAMTWNDVKN